MANKDSFIQVLQKVAKESMLETQRLQCINIAALVLKQIRTYAKSYDIDLQKDVAVKSIRAEGETEYLHVWVELFGEPIDPDRTADTPEGERIRNIIQHAESTGTIETNESGLLRVIANMY